MFDELKKVKYIKEIKGLVKIRGIFRTKVSIY